MLGKVGVSRIQPGDATLRVRGEVRDGVAVVYEQRIRGATNPWTTRRAALARSRWLVALGTELLPTGSDAGLAGPLRACGAVSAGTGDLGEPPGRVHVETGALTEPQRGDLPVRHCEYVKHPARHALGQY